MMTRQKPDNFRLSLSGFCLVDCIAFQRNPYESYYDKFVGVEMATNWREELRRLDGFPLLPCGAGAKGKAPINPQTQLALEGWQKRSYTPEQIKQMPDCVICVGTKTGPEADGLVMIDIDGSTALAYCKNFGCSVEESGWRITRDTDPARLKVAFRLKDNELSEQLAAFGKIILSTNNDPKEQVELFYGSGQCIVLGQHKDSGGHYTWCGSPKYLSEPSASWCSLIRDLIQ